VSIRYLLLIASLVFALFVVIIGFGWWDDQTKHVFGWLGLCLACLIAGWFPFAERPLNRPPPG
jgi:hypothetical protein